MKPTKEDVNYRIPEHCCATCVNSAFNSYDDPICNKLASGVTIDFAGVCDLYEEENG